MNSKCFAIFVWILIFFTTAVNQLDWKRKTLIPIILVNDFTVFFLSCRNMTISCLYVVNHLFENSLLPRYTCLLQYAFLIQMKIISTESSNNTHLT